MKQIDLLVYSVESYGSDTFQKDANAYSDNHIYLQFNIDGIKILHCPPDFDIAGKKLKFGLLKLGYIFYPLFFITDHFRIFLLFLRICIHRHIKVAVIENTYVAVIMGIFRKCGAVGKLVYIPGDWLASNKGRRSFRNYLGGNIIFPFFDYLACRLSDLVLNCTSDIADARKKFWGRQVARKEIISSYKLEIKAQRSILNACNNRIVFLGNVRNDSGLDIVIKSLKTIRKNRDIILKIIGPKSAELLNLQALASKLGVEEFIEYFGFVERTGFREAFSDVFCGLNLITSEDSYTSKTLPSKILDYLQFLVPVIATKNIGPMAKDISQRQLGLIIKPLEEDFINACDRVYLEQSGFRRNIEEYVDSSAGFSLLTEPWANA